MTKRIAVVVVALIGLLALSAVACDIADVENWGLSAWSGWSTAGPAPDPPMPEVTAARHLTVRQTRNGFRVVLSTDLPSSSLTLPAVLATTDDPSGDSLVRGAFGTVSVLQRRYWPSHHRYRDTLSWRPPRVTRVSGSPNFHVEVVSDEYGLYRPEARLLWRPARRADVPDPGVAGGVTVTGARIRATPVGAALSLASDHAVLMDPGPDRSRGAGASRVALRMDGLGEKLIALDVGYPGTPSGLSWLREVGDYQLPMVGNGLNDLVVLTGPALFLLLAVSVQGGLRRLPGAKAFRAVLLGAVCLSLGVVVVETVGNVMPSVIGVFDTWAGRVELLPASEVATYTWAAPELLIVDALFVWLGLTLRLPMVDRSAGSRLGRVLIFLTGAAVSVAAWIFGAPYFTSNHTRFYELTLVLAAFLISQVLTTAALRAARVGWGAAVPLGSVSGVVIVAGSLVTGVMTDAEQGSVNLTLRGGVLLAGVVLVLGYSLGVVRALRQFPVGRAASTPERWLGRGGIVVLNLGALGPLIHLLLARSPDSIDFWAMLGLSGALVSCTLFLAVLGTLTWMHHVSTAGEEVQVRRWLTFLLAVQTLYWFTDRWFYLPISVLLGAAVLWFFVLPRDRAVPPAPPPSTWLATVLAKLGGPVPTPDPDPAGSDPWAEGVAGAALGLVLGAPMTVVDVIALGRSPVGTDSWAFLNFFDSGLIVLGFWPLLGFLFGYAYPLIRGGGGVRKGAVLTVGTLLPPLPVALVWDWHADLVQYAAYAGETTVFLLVLGAAIGTVRPLLRAGGTWTDVLSRYRFKSLLAWTSTSVAAVLVAAVTAFATSAGGTLSDNLFGTSDNHSPANPQTSTGSSQ